MLSVTPYDDPFESEIPIAGVPDLPSLATPTSDGNLDGSVDGADFLVWAENYGAEISVDSGETPSNGDYNTDGIVDGLDYLVWVGQYGTQPLSPSEAAMVDFHGEDLQGKDGPLADVGVELARLYHEFRIHTATGAATDFAPSSSLMHVVKGQIVVDVVANVSPQATADPWQAEAASAAEVQQLIAQLEGLGATITGKYGRMVSALMPIAAIPAVAGVSGLQSMSASAMTSNVGLVDSQGDVAMRSDLARADSDVDGSGITVGVLSDSYNSQGGATGDIANGDLPPNVTVLADTGGSDEGRAMMQLIADVAPGADQAFHTAFLGQASFAQGIIDLANVAGADVIVDDVIYFAEPMFQDGVIAQAIDTVVAGGAAYFSSAGNGARDSYESPFGISGSDLVLDGANLGELHDFDPGAGVDTYQAITLAPFGSFIMSFQWADPFASVSGVGAGTDLDIYVFDTDSPTSTGDVLTAGTNNNIGGDPIELISYFNPNAFSQTVYVGIANFAGANPDLLKYVGFFGGVSIDEFDTASGTAYGHTNAAGASSVGASFYVNTPEFGVDPPVLESFSSAGAIPILYDTAGNLLPSPELRQTPDIVGPDGTNTTFFGFDVEPDGFPNFFGTSASAPHVAAVAALMLGAAGGGGSLSPQDTYSVLETTAIDMDDPASPGFDVGYDTGTGWGFVNAEAAVQSVAIPLPPVVDFPVPLDSIDPLGSLIYSGDKQSTIGSVDDTDGYTISVDPGQTITVVVGGDASLQPAVSLFRASGGGQQLEAAAIAAAAGGHAVIQTEPTRGRLAGHGPGPEKYLIEVAGAEGTTGRYSLEVILNSAVEDEAHGGDSNNTLADAQDLDPSFISLHDAIGNNLDGASPQPTRGAVLGTLDTLSVVAEVEPNDPDIVAPDLFAVAQNIDSAGWNQNPSPDIFSLGTTPHVSIQGTGDGTFDYYSFTVDANAGATFDIDYENFDSVLFLFDADGNLLAANDDNGGDPGSGGGLASYISYTFTNPGTYVIGVGEFDSFNSGGMIAGNTPDSGDVYTLHITLQDHALNAGGVDPLPEVEPNDPASTGVDLLAFAQDVSGAGFSRAEDPAITDSTAVPHISIEGTGDGSFDYYSFEVDAPGSRGIFDIDFENFDTELFLFDADGNLLAANDDSGGDPGSGGGLASYIDYTFALPGSYVIGVGEFDSSNSGGGITGNSPDDGDAYTLHVSLQGHEVVESTPDWYQFEMLAGQSTTIVAKSLTDGDVRIELYDADGNLIVAETPVGDLIENGSFESGNFSGWATSTIGLPFVDWLVGTAGSGSGFGMDPTSPQDGNFVAWNGFDGGGPMSYAMYQDVDIPLDVPAATLQWQDRVQWNFGPGSFASLPRTYDVQVRDPGTNALLETLFSFSTDTQAVNPTGDTLWQSRSANLSAYAGSTVRIQFEEFIPQSSTGPGQIEFDAISLVVSDELPPTNVDSLLHYVAPETGTYYVRVSGDGATDYSLLVNRNTDFEIEDNNDIDSARDIFATQSAGRQWVLGAVEAPESVDGLITFDELPTQPVDGLSVEGVTFDFKIGGIDSTDATFNSSRLRSTTYLSAPHLEGAANGILTMDFEQPVTSLSFGVALRTTGTVTPGFEVELFDAADVSLGVFPVTTEGLPVVSEGLFEYEGAAASRAVVDFNETAADRFALDNVEFASPATGPGDFYRVELSHGAPLEVETFTPAHQSGEFVNKLDPLVRLYDAAGNLVATNDDGASDGRNVLLRYKPSRGEEGIYYIEVTSASTDAEPAYGGEYILAVKGAASPAHGPGNGDGLVDGVDFLVWAAGFDQGTSAPASLGSAGGDFNDDGTIDGGDYLVWAANYFPAQQTSIQPALPLDAPSPEALSVETFSVVHSLAHDTALELEFGAPPTTDDEASIDAALAEANTVAGATLDAWRISLAFNAVHEQDDHDFDDVI